VDNNSEIAKQWADLMAQPYSVDNQNKISALLNPEASEWHQLSSEAQFESATDLLSMISSKVVGRPMMLNHSYATAVLGKMCLTAMSAQALFRDHEAGKLPTIDHSSIAILCRTIIEASIMYWYLTEEMTEDEWAFRHQVMKVHDAAARVRFWKAPMPEEADQSRIVLDKLRNELKAMPLFWKRSENDRAKMRGGQTVYVNGMRSVAKSMGVEETYFDGMYNYLSAQVHSTPISYFRDSEDDASQIIWSRGFSQYALHHAMTMMFRVALREIELSKLEDEFDLELLNEVREIVAGKPAPEDQLPTPKEPPPDSSAGP
jgi:hypothetical protein